MLIEEISTYATLEYADEYIETHYLKYMPIRVHWSVLTDDEKEIYLRKSLIELDKLMFSGRKRRAIQPLQFPRYRGAYYNNFVPECYPLIPFMKDEYKVPECIKQAQVENALGIINNEIKSISNKQFMKNTEINPQTGETANFNHTKLSSDKAYRLCREWLGGYRC